MFLSEDRTGEVTEVSGCNQPIRKWKKVWEVGIPLTGFNPWLVIYCIQLTPVTPVEVEAYVALGIFSFSTIHFSFIQIMVVLTFSLTSPLSHNIPDAIRPPTVYLACKTDKYINILDSCFPRVLIVRFLFYFLPPVLADLTLPGRWSKYAVGMNVTFSLINAGNP